MPRPVASLLDLPRLVALLSVAVAAAAPAAAETFVFERLNRTFRNDGAVMAPVTQGPMTIELTSPTNALVLESHRLVLEPAGEGTHRARLELTLAGSGSLIADLLVSGLTNRIEDDVTLPRQEKVLEGIIRLDKVPGGYAVTPVELPERFEVAIESRLAGRLVSTCDGLAALPFLPLSCDGLERALSIANVPLPPAGEAYLLPNTELTDADREALDRYLAAASARGSG